VTIDDVPHAQQNLRRSRRSPSSWWCVPAGMPCFPDNRPSVIFEDDFNISPS